MSPFLENGKGNFHLVGIGGVGMAGLAFHLAQRGCCVTGCDQVHTSLMGWLKEKGISIEIGHHKDHIKVNLAGLIVSAAVAREHPEWLAADKLSVPVFGRGQTLAALLAYYQSICVCGTHGKTTTSTFIAQLLRASDRDVSFCIGGEVPQLGGVAAIGEEPIMVVEVDESDGSLQLYDADIAVCTNIDYDHAEYFADGMAYNACFDQFSKKIKEKLIYCFDDLGARSLFKDRPNTLSYGFTQGANLYAYGLNMSSDTMRFNVQFKGSILGSLSLNLTGRHNALNALGACAVGLYYGLSFEVMAQKFEQLSLPKRRYDICYEVDHITVISDYAHHPEEIQALIQTAKLRSHSRIFAIFQPHRYSRTSTFRLAFPPAFVGIDELVLTPVYAASEDPLVGGRSEDLYQAFSAYNQTSTLFIKDLKKAWHHIRDQLVSGDILLLIGAGDVEMISTWVNEDLKKHTYC